MELRKLREELRMGRSVFDMPLRVTFYARVSTDKDEQRSSLENQVQYYTELIRGRPNWAFVPGYIDEGVSGTSTKKREDFNRMIRDAQNGVFDFIITKEISRFSRSTLDSIRYTQELLEHGVGVLFQNDNLNTLDPDSEFRLVVMAGVAQDEVRKLSERLKFGFRQAIKNGRVLGNDRLYGYNKRNCVLTVNEPEAELIRIIFDLYANHGLGLRRLSQRLFELGYTSREGNAFNQLTIRHILENPKYKGWYCGHKSQSLDYRSRKKALLDEQEWVMYPDPGIPAIVPEELWDRAHALLLERSRKAGGHASGAFHDRYPYSGKIFCGRHGTAFHRQVRRGAAGETESWRCRVYRQRGSAACAAPALRSEELTAVMAEIFRTELVDKQGLADCLMKILRAAARDLDSPRPRRVEEERARLEAKKERLLELSVAGALDISEFKTRNDALNRQLRELESRRADPGPGLDVARIREELGRVLDPAGEMNAVLAAAILERVTVRAESTASELMLDVLLKTGRRYAAAFRREKSSFRITCLKSIIPNPPIRRT